MAARRPRIISRDVVRMSDAKKASMPLVTISLGLGFEKPKRTHVDEIYALIEEASYLRFEDEDGRPWIERNCVEDCGSSIYLVRFRCPLEALHTRASLNHVVENVCKTLKSDIRYFCVERENAYLGNIRLRYYECAWIIFENELCGTDGCEGDVEEHEDCESCIDSLEEIDGELCDESTDREVDARMEESLENFV